MQETHGLDAEFVEEMDLKTERIRSALKAQCFSYDELLENLALVTLGYEEMNAVVDAMIEDQKDIGEFLRQIATSEAGKIKELDTRLLEIRTSAKVMAMKSLLAGVDLQKTAQARKGALAKLTNDTNGKQKEKAFVRECWNEWQKKPESYDSQAAFARDMLNKCEHLTSQKKIEDWCREWNKSTSLS